MLAPITEISHWLENFTPVAAFIIGLLSIPHCVSMCGPLSLSVNRSSLGLGVYQVGRLMGYTFIVLTASMLGKQIIQKLSINIQGFVGFTIGLTLLVLGINILRGKGTSLAIPFFSKVHSKLTYLLVGSSQLGASFIMGGSSVLLPCGLLYAVIVASIAVQSFPLAFLSILFFWLGSLPATFIAPYVLRKTLGPLFDRRPRLIGILLLVLGLMSMGHRIGHQNYQSSGHTHQCH